MSDLFCFGCNYPGEEHDERCPEYVDVERLVAQRDRLDGEVVALSAENGKLRGLLQAVVIHLEEASPRPRSAVLQDLLDRANHPLGRRGL